MYEPQISLPNRLCASQTGKWNHTNVNRTNNIPTQGVGGGSNWIVACGVGREWENEIPWTLNGKAEWFPVNLFYGPSWNILQELKWHLFGSFFTPEIVDLHFKSRALQYSARGWMSSMDRKEKEWRKKVPPTWDIKISSPQHLVSKLKFVLIHFFLLSSPPIQFSLFHVVNFLPQSYLLSWWWVCGGVAVVSHKFR